MLSLEGLSQITSVEYLAIENNYSLVSLKGLENLAETDYFSIFGNASLSSIEAISNLTSITGDLVIEENPVLSMKLVHEMRNRVIDGDVKTIID